MDDGSPRLEVGFAIDTGASFGELQLLEKAMDSTEGKIIADAARIERATSGMVKVGGAVAEITSFGNAASREMQALARAKAQTEKAGEALIRQLDRETAAVGKTRDEVRALRAEELAAKAAQQGNTDLAMRLRAAETENFAVKLGQLRQARFAEEAAAEAGALASQRAAAAMQAEAATAERLAREQAMLAAEVRASAAAQDADVAAAFRMRAATDPLFAATSRLNDEIAESTRLYQVGVTAPAEYARQQQVLTERLREAERAHDATGFATRRLGANAKLSTGDMLNLGYQINDVVVSLASGQKPFTVFAQQGAQIGQIAAQSGVGLRGMALATGALLVPFAPLIAVVALAASGFALFNRSITSGIDTQPMIDGLGLTRDEIKRLKDTSVTAGDTMTATFEVLMERVGINMDGVKKFFGGAMDFLTTVGRDTLAGLYTMFVGTFRAIGTVVQNLKEGDFDNILSDMDKAVFSTFDKAKAGLSKFGQDVRDRATANKRRDLEDQARELRLDRTPKSPKVDRRAEQLAREAQAVEAQIKNLYGLAEAYGVSGAAALISEARVKAESEAIKKRADVGERVSRQIRLAIAERVKDAAQSTAGLREQAEMQALVNAEVAAGNVPATLAGELLRDRMEDQKLLAAIEAARIAKDVTGAAAAEAALEAQRGARVRLTDAEREAQRIVAMAEGEQQLAFMREELRLIGATEEARVRALAVLRAEQEARDKGWGGEGAADYIRQQEEIAAGQFKVSVEARRLETELGLVAQRADEAADLMSRSFGRVGSAIGDAISILGRYGEEQDRIDKLVNAGTFTREQGAKRSADLQMNSLIGITGAAKNLFKEHSKGYQAMAAAEKALTIIQLARTAIDVAGGAAKMFATLGPFAFPAVAAMLGVMASLGFGGGSASAKPPETNTGTGTVLGDSTAESESIKRAIDALKEVDTVMLGYSREMAASLRSIDSQIGGFASLIVRSGDVNASSSVAEGFKANAIGSVLGSIPLVGGILKGLFGTKTKVVGSGLFGGPQTLEDILGDGFDASYFSDVQRKKKFLGLTTSTKYRTEFAGADPMLENQFTLILRSFSDAIAASAGPLGEATADIKSRLNGFVVDIGKIDLQDLTGEEIQERLNAVFGAAADRMAGAAFPGIERFQKVGEGAFETLVRVASTVEAVTDALDMLGGTARTIGIDAKVALADQFDGIGALTGATSAYFDRFYSEAEQAAARSAQFARVFAGLGLTMPASLATFRQLVEAQNLTTDAGRATYATLLQLAPAFADLQEAMNGARSATDILAERSDLERRLLEVQGDTAAIRALDLAKLDASNRALQMQIWAVQDAQEAARAADELRRAWTDVGKSIMDEVARIRGLTDPEGAGGFAMRQGAFNAATLAARAGDQNAAKLLPGLSQALLNAATDAATSRQELERVQAQTAASLEATFAAINGLGTPASAAASAERLMAAMAASPAAGGAGAPANDDLAAEVAALRREVAAMRQENNTGHAATASAGNRAAKVLETVSAPSGGDAINVASAA